MVAGGGEDGEVFLSSCLTSQHHHHEGHISKNTQGDSPFLLGPP